MHNYIPLLGAINPQNVINITLALFYVKVEEIKHKYTSVALYLMSKLIKRYQNAVVYGTLTPKKIKALIQIARAMFTILKPHAKERIKSCLINN
jgi:hypothetical protein